MDDNPPQNPQEKRRDAPSGASRSQAPDGTWRSPALDGTGKSLLKAIPFLKVDPPATLARALRAGIFEIFFVSVVLVLLFGILNYFNILSLSALYPQLGFLPQNQVLPTISILNQLSCPSLKEFCQKGESVIKDKKYIGFGGKLASGSAIFAAFDGDLTAITKKGKFKILYLDNPNLKARATYFLRGQIIKNGKISKGEQIAITNGKTISIYDNNSLIFSVIQDYPATNNPVILTREQFE